MKSGFWHLLLPSTRGTGFKQCQEIYSFHQTWVQSRRSLQRCPPSVSLNSQSGSLQPEQRVLIQLQGYKNKFRNHSNPSGLIQSFFNYSVSMVNPEFGPITSSSLGSWLSIITDTCGHLLRGIPSHLNYSHSLPITHDLLLSWIFLWLNSSLSGCFLFCLPPWT